MEDLCLRFLTSKDVPDIAPVDSVSLLKSMIKKFPNEGLQILPSTVQKLEQALRSLLQKHGPESICLEEGAPIGLKRRTLLLSYEKGRLLGGEEPASLEVFLKKNAAKRKAVVKQRIATKKLRKDDKLIQEVLSAEEILGKVTYAQSKEAEAIEKNLQLMLRPSQKETWYLEKVKKNFTRPFHEICEYPSKEECKKERPNCTKIHFRKVLNSLTDETLGDCSFLSNTHKTSNCKYVHYEYDLESQAIIENLLSKTFPPPLAPLPAQWVRCDVRKFDMTVLGKFSVILADPPWEIHQQLPYGTMTDDEMRSMNLQALMDEGYIFLWVTGRAMELGRECLKIWGYERVDEIIWLKTNQVHRASRTGRTGHWLNHSKEHCIVGVKGNPKFQTGLDCDVIVSEVRETSRKPDELYRMIERLAPSSRKIEIFGREHNLRDGWVTLGNQLPGNNILEPEVLERYRRRYPNGDPDTKGNPPPPEILPSQDSDGLQDYPSSSSMAL